jgi:hypothetical protein
MGPLQREQTIGGKPPPAVCVELLCELGFFCVGSDMAVTSI